jgi:hypothetical protein
LLNPKVAVVFQAVGETPAAITNKTPQHVVVRQRILHHRAHPSFVRLRSFRLERPTTFDWRWHSIDDKKCSTATHPDL